MNNFTYYAPTKYFFGKGAEEKAGEQLSTLKAKRTLVVFGQSSAKKSGLLDRVINSLSKYGIEAICLGGVKPNPMDDLVYEGIKICRLQNVDSLLAIGGGSVIDTAKAIAAGTPYEGDFWDFFSGKAQPQEALPIGVVLTIPAAGSEGSGNAVITKTEGKIKISIRTDYVLRPKFSLLNPELTFTLPSSQSAAGIADMMAHIMERYFSNTTNVEVTDRISEGILKAIISQAPIVIESPTDYDARANIMWSGTLAHNGICGCGREEDWSSHALEHEISAVYDVAHGAGLAVVFPAWMTFMAHKNPTKIAQFARRIFNIDYVNDYMAAKSGIERLKMFFASIGLPTSFKQLGIENPDIDLLVQRLHTNKGLTIGNYYSITKRESTELYHLMI